MYSADQYIFPDSAAEAARLLQKSPSARVIAGGTWLRMGTQHISTLIDLSRLGLDRIESKDGEIRIGAFSTLRSVETSGLLGDRFSGALSSCVSGIVGVQFRNCATIGAGVYNGYGFSDPLTVLLALDAEVSLSLAGRMPIGEYLKIRRCRSNRDVLEYIYLKDDGRKAAFESFRLTATDYPVLNLCLTEDTAAVGGRPGRAMRCPEAEKLMKENKTGAAAETLAGLPYGSNMRASAEYRRVLSRVLFEDASEKLREVRA